jgi:pyruvate dehydrogenase E1 component alpha subunit
VLNSDGTLVAGAAPKMDANLVTEAVRWMFLSRTYDGRAVALQKQGKWNRYPAGTGQEASIVGSMIALDPSIDWLVPQYRELVACVRHGYPLERITARYMGRYEPSRIPDGVLVLPMQVALAAQLQHATGLAWGLRLQKKPGVVLAYVGEGASSEGDFHEALNLAGVAKAPIVFFLQNNQWAMSTSREIQSATPSFSLRAGGYGFLGVEVDGNDLLAVYDVTVDAVTRARAGLGPTLIEAVTYRESFHNTSDDPSKYMDVDAYEAAKGRDPITRVTDYLASLGRWDERLQMEMMANVASEIDNALEKADASPPPRLEDAVDNVFAQPTERLRRQAEGARS